MLKSVCFVVILYSDPLAQKIHSFGLISYKKSMEYAQLIRHYSNIHKIDPHIFIAILKVESQLGTNTKSINGQDFGPMQINEWWFDRFKINKNDVLSPHGSIKYASQILAHNKKLKGKTDCRWWSYYHSWSTELRKKYEYKIERVFDRLGIEINCRK
jgi:soluble lytic murein transglycosylase-like protein